MGAWGYESSANDHCWDNLWAENIHEMTQQEADDTIQELRKLDRAGRHYESIMVGVVTWILYQELKAPQKAIQFAIDCCNKMLDSNDPCYSEEVENYDNVESRLKCIREEKAALEAALVNDGKGQAKHVKGLLEKIFEREGEIEHDEPETGN